MSQIVITGGAGFIGVNAARHFAGRGWRVCLVDDLSRKGSPENLDWLRGEAAIDFERADIRDAAALEAIVAARRPRAVLHLAGQVAVTTSVVDPRTDFEINALGTFNVLESVRRKSPDTFFIDASTNKVYGRMGHIGVVERNGRYEYRDLPGGVDEQQPLDFHSPYGCSKGAGDQYVRDYARIYGLRTVVFRQSCIYGTRQYGVEDQGWGPIPAAMISELSFGRFYNLLVKRQDDPASTTFLLGIENLPLQAEKSLYDLAMWAGEHAELSDYIKQTPSESICAALQADSVPAPLSGEFSDRFAAHLAEFGHTLYDPRLRQNHPR